jgi:hypothetical protein
VSGECFQKNKYGSSTKNNVRHKKGGGRMMRIRKISILVVVGVFALLSLGYAYENDHRQLAEELMVLMEVDKNLEKGFEMLKQQQMDLIKNLIKKMRLPKEVSKEDLEKIASIQGEIMDIMSKELG